MTPRRFLLSGAALLSVALTGCSSNPAPATEHVASASQPGRDSDIITGAELANPMFSAGSALDAVRRLRPRFLATRGNGSIRTSDAGTVHVSIDNGALQTVNALSRMRATDISEIRFLNATQAAQRFGTQAATGAVMLVKSF